MSLTSDEVTLTKKIAAILATTAWSTVPIEFPGNPRDPAGGKIIRVQFKHGPSRNTEIGGRRRRHTGSAIIQLQMPTGSGKGELLAVADALEVGFQRFASGALRCTAASYRDGVPEASFITGTVDVPYFSDYSS